MMGYDVPRDEVFVDLRTTQHTDGPLTYKFGGTRLQAIPVTHLPSAVAGNLLKMRDQGERILGHQLNAVLINCYKNGSDSVSDHKDNDDTMFPGSKVLSVSVGATRLFKIKPDTIPEGKKRRESFKIPLKGGSALVMLPRFQELFEHGIPKSKRADVGKRFNLTFRKLIVS